MMPSTLVLTEKKTFLMFHRKEITMEEYKTSTQKDEYESLYKNDDVLKNDKITDENEGIVENAKDFINFKNIHNRE